MPDHRYHPAAPGWFLLTREGLALGLDPGTREELLDALWPLVRDGSEPAALLDEITRGGISTAPGFVLLAESPTGWQVFARGDVVVEIGGSDDVVDGRKATAWVEREVAGSPALRVRPAGASAAGLFHPMRVGVVVTDGWTAGEEPVAEEPVAEEPAARAPVAQPAEAESAVEPPAAPAPRLAPEPPAASKPMERVVATERSLPTETISVSEATEVVPPEDTEIVPPEDEEGAPPTGRDSGYDHLFGSTVARKVEDAAMREGDGEQAEPRDDRTKVATDLAARRALRRAAKQAAEAERASAGPRHWLELSTGGTEELDGTVIVGRAPKATRVSAGNIPRLVTMSTPNQDISRTHAQIAFDGGTVVVTDLHSSNGTFVVLPGRAPQKIRPGEPTPVVADTVIDLGDGATLTVRVEA